MAIIGIAIGIFLGLVIWVITDIIEDNQSLKTGNKVKIIKTGEIGYICRIGNMYGDRPEYNIKHENGKYSIHYREELKFISSGTFEELNKK